MQITFFDALKKIYKRMLIIFSLCLIANGCSKNVDIDTAKELARKGEASKAFEILMPFALQGNSDAQFCIGNMYSVGHGVKQNSAEALKWYLRSARQNNGDAQFYLSIMYLDGKGIEKNECEGLNWLQKAADNGVANAQINLSACYYSGRLVKQDYKQALFWLQKAIDKNDAEAIARMSAIYTEGKAVEKNGQKALEYLQKAAEMNHPEAQYMMWKMNIHMDSLKDGTPWLIASAKNGNIRSQLVLGIIYTAIDKKDKANKWFVSASTQKKLPPGTIEKAEEYAESIKKNNRLELCKLAISYVERILPQDK